MPSRAEYIYWHECWPEALLNIIREFMASSDVAGLLGISSLAVCHRQSVVHEAAVCALVREVLHGLEEAKEIRKRLKERENELKEKGLYDVMEKRATLLERGLVPLPRLEKTITGYRKQAREIYLKLKNAGLLKVEKHSLTPSGNPILWIGLDGKWDRLVEDIRTKGTSNEMFSSSLGIMIYIAVDRRGFTTVLPMACAILASEKKGGEITYEELKAYYYGNVKALNIILERQREKTDALKIFPSDDGRRLIVNRNTAYAVRIWRKEANRLARMRGLGV